MYRLLLFSRVWRLINGHSILLVQLFLIYYGLPQLFPVFTKMDAITACVKGNFNGDE